MIDCRCGNVEQSFSDRCFQGPIAFLLVGQPDGNGRFQSLTAGLIASKPDFLDHDQEFRIVVLRLSAGGLFGPGSSPLFRAEDSNSVLPVVTRDLTELTELIQDELFGGAITFPVTLLDGQKKSLACLFQHLCNPLVFGYI